MAGKDRDAMNSGEEKQALSAESVQVEEETVVSDSGAEHTEPVADGVDVAELESHIKQLSQEREQIAAQYTRLRADFENFRRRKEEEISNLKQSAAADVATRLLPVLDNLERAASATADEADAAAENQFLQGVNLVLRQFKQVFEEIGVEAIPGAGHPFNPEVHEAVMQVDPADTYEPGTVVEELQRGYRMGDRILRYSMVNVAASD